MEEDKRRKGVVSMYPFEDTLALFVLFMWLPYMPRMAVYGLFIVWKLQYSHISGKWALRLLAITTVLSFIFIYSTPILYEPLQIFALANVAASLAGSQDSMMNALFAAATSVLVRLWRCAYSVFVLNGTCTLFDAPPALPALAIPDNGPFNTLFSAWHYSFAILRFLTTLDWHLHLGVIVAQSLTVTAIFLAMSQEYGVIAAKDPTERIASAAGGMPRILLKQHVEQTANESSNISIPGSAGGSLMLVTTNTPTSHLGSTPPPVATATATPAPVKKKRRLAAIWSRQPLWTACSLLRLAFTAREEEVTINRLPLPRIRFVEDERVGLSIENPESHSFKVDGVEWVQVFFDSANDLVVISGLTRCSTYTIEVYNKVSGKTCVLSVSTEVPESVTQVKKQAPVNTLSEALEKAKSSLADEKARLRKMRKDYAKILTNLRNENDAQAARLDRTSKYDSKSSNRIQSLQDAERQLQQEIQALETASANLEERFTKSLSEFSSRKETLLAQRETYENKLDIIKQESREWNEQRQYLRTEDERLASKLQKLKQRDARLEEELNEVRVALEEPVNTLLSRRKAMRQSKLARRETLQTEFEASIHKLESGIKDVENRTRMFQEATDKWGQQQNWSVSG